MARTLVFAFGLGTALDFIMASLGLAVIFLADSPLGYITCLAASFALMSLRLCMVKIQAQTNILHMWMRWALRLAVILDFYAISNSVAAYIILKYPLFRPAEMSWMTISGSAGIPVLLVSLALVLFLVASPMFLSYLVEQDFNYSQNPASGKGGHAARPTTPTPPPVPGSA